MNAEEMCKDWDAIFKILPLNWKDICQDMGILSLGNYVFTDPEATMKVMLCYLMSGDSFDTVAGRAVNQGILKHVSGVAIFNKFRKCGNYFKALSEIMIKRKTQEALQERTYPWVIRAFDGTHITAPETRANSLILHMSMDVTNGVMDYVEVTDIYQKETLKRLPVSSGELILADSGYGNRDGISYIVENEAHVIVRTNFFGLPVCNMDGSKFEYLSKFKGMSEYDERSFNVFFEQNGTIISGRICAFKRDKINTTKTIKEITRNAQKRGNKPPSEEAKIAAGYIFVFTTLSDDEMPKCDVLSLYRLRWQIEIYFKKLKSQFEVGTPPSRSKQSLAAWVHGKILATLLIEGFADNAKPFPPSAE